MTSLNKPTPAPPPTPAASGSVVAPRIRRLEIRRFRGIEHLVWHPAAGVNVILGGGDVGKSTILDAIAVLLSPTNPTNISDFDYHDRDVSAGFSIEAVVSVPDDGCIHYQTKASWPWEWNGKTAVPPSADAESPTNDPVFCLRVSADDDLELVYEIVQPDGTADHLSYNMRRAIGLVRLTGDDRNDRDLRLVYGSALDRLLSDKGLRSRMTNEMAQVQVAPQLDDNATTALSALNDAFIKHDLPNGLSLALTGGAGPSIASMVGLTAKRQNVSLPLTAWGAGTRRLAALAIAQQTRIAAPITVVDEIERGLEPYRQQTLIAELVARPSQTFLTTHSATSMRAAAYAALWYLDRTAKIGPLQGAEIKQLIVRNPNALLARLTIIVEGLTELGLVGRLLQRAFGCPLNPLGLEIAKGNGNEQTLALLEQLSRASVSFGAFVDNENRNSGRWKALNRTLGDLLFQWKTGCTEENIIAAVPDGKLFDLVADPRDEKTGIRLRTLAVRLGVTNNDRSTLEAAAKAASIELRSVILEAALGKAPETVNDTTRKEFRRHAEQWFKSVDGGRELEGKMFTLGLWPALSGQLLPFCNAVLKAFGRAPLKELPA